MRASEQVLTRKSNNIKHTGPNLLLPEEVLVLLSDSQTVRRGAQLQLGYRLNKNTMTDKGQSKLAAFIGKPTSESWRLQY